VWNVWCCTVGNCCYAYGVSIIYCSGEGFLFVCYLSCSVASFACSWNNIYRGWTNNGNRQYRNETVCVGCTERTLVVSFVILLLVLYSASVNALQIAFSNCMKVLQNGRVLRFSKRTDCWCVCSWSICNQNTHYITCIQNSSFQGEDDITNHGRTSTAKRNNGWKPKISEKDRHTLNSIVSINHSSTAVKVTVEFNIHFEDRFHKNSLTIASQLQQPKYSCNCWISDSLKQC
jgi:hypothetical protein